VNQPVQRRTEKHSNEPLGLPVPFVRVRSASDSETEPRSGSSYLQPRVRLRSRADSDVEWAGGGPLRPRRLHPMCRQHRAAQEPAYAGRGRPPSRPSGRADRTNPPSRSRLPGAVPRVCRRRADLHRPQIPRELVASAYKAAAVHVLPSFAEGSALSTMEAAAAGCDVVTSNRGSELEYYGDLVRTCDPLSPSSIRAAIKHALYDPRGEQLAAHMCGFPWSRTAEATLRVLRPRDRRVIHGQSPVHEAEPQRRAMPTCPGYLSTRRGASHQRRDAALG
jgi:hypothetical protein